MTLRTFSHRLTAALLTTRLATAVAPALPDLEALAIEGPSAAGTAQVVTLTNTVANQGPDDAGNWRYRLYLSGDATITTDDVVLATSPLYAEFVAFATNTHLNTVTIPSGTATGTYHFGVIIDPLQEVAEADEGNNARASTAVPIRVGADLVALAIGGPASAGTAQDLELTSAIANTGVGASANWRYRLYLSDDATITTGDVLLKASPLYAGMPAASTNVWLDPVTIPADTPPGTYYFGLLVDPANEVTEASEANNVAVAAATTVHYGPDLTVLAVTALSHAAAGQPLILSNVLANAGVGDCGNWQYDLYLSTDAAITTGDVWLASSPMYETFAAASTNAFAISVPLPPDTPSGTFYCGAIIDPHNTVAEADEGNNARASAPTGIGMGIAQISQQTNMLALRITGLTVSGTYHVQRASALVPVADWSTVSDAITLTNTVTWTDPLPGASTQRFYRVLGD